MTIEQTDNWLTGAVEKIYESNYGQELPAEPEAHDLPAREFRYLINNVNIICGVSPGHDIGKEVIAYLRARAAALPMINTAPTPWVSQTQPFEGNYAGARVSLYALRALATDLQPVLRGRKFSDGICKALDNSLYTHLNNHRG